MMDHRQVSRLDWWLEGHIRSQWATVNLVKKTNIKILSVGLNLMTVSELKSRDPIDVT